MRNKRVENKTKEMKEKIVEFSQDSSSSLKESSFDIKEIANWGVISWKMSLKSVLFEF